MSTLPFTCEKSSATGSGGMVVTNHPLGTAAGAEMLHAGGNAVDAAVAALLTLTVVEPMMVGIVGGGLAHLRMADGTSVVFDGLAQAAGSMRPDIYTPVADAGPRYMEALDQRNTTGPSSVAVPGNLAAWARMHARFGRLPWADLLEPAIRHAARGFAITPYLSGAIAENAEMLGRDPEAAALFLPGGSAPATGSRLVMGDYAESLRLIQAEGARALHGGALGAALAASMNAGEASGWITEQDLRDYAVVERQPLVGHYRGHDILGPPPPASSGVHVPQMLNMLSAFNVAAMGFDNPATLHLLAEVIRLAFVDRRAHSGDPAFVDVPVERLMSMAHADESRARIQPLAPPPASPAPGYESRDTTHITIADRDGNIVTATHTINGIFGARYIVPGTGMLPNNYMSNFDPHPGQALSVAPGKRVPTSMAPLIVLRDGRPVWALGLPGGLRIFPSAMQALVNLIDHAMPLQAAVEAPRLWTQGAEVEIEKGHAHHAQALRAQGHEVRIMPHVGGGMNAIAFRADGSMEGAACWRADGTVAALAGGPARPGIRFWPDRAPGQDSGTPAGS